MQGERAHLNPMWRTEVWVPIVVPTSTQTIKSVRPCCVSCAHVVCVCVCVCVCVDLCECVWICVRVRRRWWFAAWRARADVIVDTAARLRHQQPAPRNRHFVALPPLLPFPRPAHPPWAVARRTGLRPAIDRFDDFDPDPPFDYDEVLGLGLRARRSERARRHVLRQAQRRLAARLGLAALGQPLRRAGGCCIVAWSRRYKSRPLREPQTHTYLRSVGLGGAPLNPPDARRARY